MVEEHELRVTAHCAIKGKHSILYDYEWNPKCNYYIDSINCIYFQLYSLNK